MDNLEITKYVENLSRQQVIEDITTVSGGANIAYHSKSWRHRVDDTELIDEDLIYSEMTDILLDELTEIGMDFAVPRGDIVNKLHFMEAMVELRARIDSDNLAAFIRQLDADKDKDEIITRLTDEGSRIDPGLVWYLINQFKAYSPLHKRLHVLYQNMDQLVHSTEKFFDHVDAVIDQAEEDESEIDTREHDIPEMEKYMTDHKKARARMEQALKDIQQDPPEDPYGVLDKLMVKFNRAGSNNMRDNRSNPAGGYHERNTYHPAMVTKAETFNSANAAAVAVFLTGFTTYNSLKARLEQLTENYAIPGDRSAAIREYFRMLTQTSLELPEGGEL